MWFVAAGLFAAASATFGVWLNSCNPGRCTVIADLLVVFATGAGTILSYLLLVPVIAACGLPWVRTVIATIAGLLAVAAAICASSAIRSAAPVRVIFPASDPPAGKRRGGCGGCGGR